MNGSSKAIQITLSENDRDGSSDECTTIDDDCRARTIECDGLVNSQVAIDNDLARSGKDNDWLLN